MSAACRRRSPAVWLSACSCALLLAGCGGSGRKAEPPPALPPDLARHVAGEADAIAQQLDAGDACGALDRAKRLQQETIAAISRVPAPLQEDLQAGVNAVVGSITCVPPAPPPPPATPPKEHGKGHGKHKKDKQGDQD